MTGVLSEVRVKICGLTRREDAECAAELGASYLGFVLARSPREADPDQLARWLPDFRRARPGVRTVGVFVRPRLDVLCERVERLGLDLVQIHGWLPELAPAEVAPGRSESPLPVPWIRAVRPDELPGERSEGSGPWAWLADTPSQTVAGGTGQVFDWSVLPGPMRSYRLFLAGGLSPRNVAEAIEEVRPFAVDASSRLETAPGEKDPELLEKFFGAIRSVARISTADASIDDPRREDSR